MKLFGDNKYLKGKEIPKLRDGRNDYEDIWIERDIPRVKRIVSIYFLTAIMLFVSVAIIFLSGSVSAHSLNTDSFWGRNTERIVSFFAK